MNMKICDKWPVWGCLAIVAIVAAGCGKTEPPRFYANELQMKLKDVQPFQQQEIALALAAMYGTPDEPFVLPETGLDLVKIQLAAGPVYGDQQGSQRGLYRRHCVHCHGTTGDGMGPTAAVLNPYPRDYRPGIFKYKSTERPAKPTHADLVRILREGIMGTAMPSFDLLQDDEISALVEYVKYLTMRGETEKSLIQYVGDELSDQDHLPMTREILVETVLPPIIKGWDDAKTLVVAPPAHPEGELAQSVKIGQELFYGAKANCIKCHGNSSLGDGQTTDFDDWNKPVAEAKKAVLKERADIAADKEMTAQDRRTKLAKLADMSAVLEYDVLPPRTITPRNLRQGYYRFGRRPLDLFRRVHAGINGAPMPGVGPASPGATGTLSPEDIWHLVDYVQSLPYEPISQPFKHSSAPPREQL
jgi:mono/diheme cytochrome c family protein